MGSGRWTRRLPGIEPAKHTPPKGSAPTTRRGLGPVRDPRAGLGCHDRGVSIHRGDTWAATGDKAPALTEGGFGHGWERLGDIAEPQDAFWRVVRCFNKGESTPRTVSVWIHAELHSAIGQWLLSHQDEHGSGQVANEAGPRIWLALAAWSDPGARLLLTRQTARLGSSKLRAPEVHPGRNAEPSRPLCLRIESGDGGLLERLA